MSDSDAAERGSRVDGARTLTRRQALAGLGLGATGLGGFEALDNVFLGYGVLVGTNLRSQPLGRFASAALEASDTAMPADEYRVAVAGSDVVVTRGDERVATAPVGDVDAARSVDAANDLPGSPVAELAADVAALRAGEFEFAFSQYPTLFDRTRAAESRPRTVGALRGPRFEALSDSLVRALAGASPAAPRAVLEGLVDGFREYTSYDVPRYLAGAVEDNVLLGAVDLRRHFTSPTSAEAIVEGRNTGLFCYTFAHRAIECLHAAAATAQTPPVFGGVVTDHRHKHAYNAVGTVVREDGELVVPVTFVDYTHSTLYDDLHLRGLLGEGLKAYDDRHRTDGIYWNRYARV
ncbi:MAG: hypothetical protein ABEJ70_02040 [Halobacteriaceae archaeon]